MNQNKKQNKTSWSEIQINMAKVLGKIEAMKELINDETENDDDGRKPCWCSQCGEKNPSYCFVSDFESSEHFGSVATHKMTWAQSDCCEAVVVDAEGDGVQEHDGF